MNLWSMKRAFNSTTRNHNSKAINLVPRIFNLFLDGEGGEIKDPGKAVVSELVYNSHNNVLYSSSVLKSDACLCKLRILCSVVYKRT